MIAAGMWQAQGRVPRPAAQRGREGDLLRIESPRRAWFMDRGPVCTLIAFVDDATGRWVYGRFVPSETSLDYLQALYSCVSRFGRPLACRACGSGAGPVKQMMSQFERAARALDIELIVAPGIEEDVERRMRPPQDQLLQALRMAGAASIAEGNEVLDSFIAEYNGRLAPPATETRPAYRKVMQSDRALRWLCSEHHQRTLSPLLTCLFRGRLFLVDASSAMACQLRGTQVTVCDDGLSDRPVLVCRSKPLRYRVFDRSLPLPARTGDLGEPYRQDRGSLREGRRDSDLHG